MARFALSPLAQRRLERFRANRRGVWALRLFLALFAASLLAEFIANDRPLLIVDQGRWYVPVLADYTEAELGGDFATAANYRDPFLQQILAQRQATVIWPLIPYSGSSIDRTLDHFPAPPAAAHWLGTDQGGKDVVAILIYGFRLSVLFGLSLTLAGSAIGVMAGLVQGYFGGRIDLFFQRFIEIWSGMPVLFLLIILSSIIEPTFLWLLVIMVLFNWMELVDLVRAEALKARNFDYVRAARALGLGHGRIMLRHVLPNAMVATITFMPFILNGSITTLTSLDFLGLGLQNGGASLGDLLNQGKSNLQAPWLGLTGFFAIATILTLLVFVGEATRDAFDPRKGP